MSETNTTDLESLQVDSESDRITHSNPPPSQKSSSVCCQGYGLRLVLFWFLCVTTSIILTVIIVFTQINHLQNQINDLQTQSNGYQQQISSVRAEALAGHGDSVTALGFGVTCPPNTQYTSNTAGSMVALNCFTQSSWLSDANPSNPAELPYTITTAGLYQIVVRGPFELSPNAVVPSGSRAVQLYLMVDGSPLLISGSNEDDLSLQAFVSLGVGDIISLSAVHQFSGVISYGTDGEPFTFSLLLSGIIGESN